MFKFYKFILKAYPQVKLKDEKNKILYRRSRLIFKLQLRKRFAAS